jgi:general secretion pathway protein A
MYAHFFGLKESPFNLTPDSRYFFLSPRHREALNYLLYGIHERKGFILLTGGIGTGKTTICRSLLAHLDASVDTALIFNSFMSDLEILETACREFGIPKDRGKGTVKSYIDDLNEFLLANFAAGRISVLIIDEAQNLSLGALEQIRMISNLETEREKLIQIVLIGQPELRDTLGSPSLKQLNERITVRYHLDPLSPTDIRQYISHRMTVAGGNGNLKFSEAAHRGIYRHSKGIPRRINAICDRALLIAYTQNRANVGKKTIASAVRDVQGGAARRMTGRKWFLIAAAVLALIAAGAILAGIRHAETAAFFRTYLTW